MRRPRSVAFVLALAALSFAAAAQPAASPALANVGEEALRIKADIAFLASEELQGRRAGTPEADKTAAWLAGRFEAVGLEPAGPGGAWLQPFEFIDGVDLGGKNRLETGASKKPWAVGIDWRPLAFTAAGAVEGDVVFAGYGIVAKDLGYDDYEGLDVKDKVVLVLRYSPDGDDEKSPFSTFAALRFKAAVAREKGAKALFVVAGPLTKDVPDDLIALRTDAALSDAGIAAASVKRAAAKGGTEVHHGADDNASGVAAMVEVARDLSARRATLARSVLFIGFAAEELGTLGSLHFTKNPTVPWESVVAMFNMDMVGRLRGDKLDVQGVGTSPAWKGLVESSNADAKLKLALLEGGFGPSDHSPFYAAKKPVLFVFTGAHADYHKPSDTADKIDAEGIVRVVRFLEPIVTSVASAPERIAFTEVKGSAAPSTGGSRSFRVWVGTIPDFSEEGQGVKLSGVTGGSPAEKAGLMAGDTIVRFADKDIRNLYDYTYALQGRKPGEKASIVVKRVEGGKAVEKTFEVTLGARPDANK